mgnify:CR=1 FL=1
MSDEKKILKFYKCEIKSIDADALTVDAIVSTKQVDRDGDVVLPAAFEKRLKSYKQHPVLLSSHRYDDLRKQIGEAESVKVTDKGLETRFRYYAGMGNDEADWAWVLAQKGIASFSIGFIGHEFEWIKEKSDAGEFITGRKFTDVELLEISQVVVPSNRQALQLGRSAAQEEAELCEMAIKGFEAGDLKEPERKNFAKKDNESGADKDAGADGKNDEEEAAGEEQQMPEASSGVKPDAKESHYSETLFSEGDGEPDPRPALTGGDVEGAIKRETERLLQKNKEKL